MASKQIIDQAAHSLAGAALLLPAAMWPGPLTFALAGLCVGLVRELTEEGPPASLAALRSVAESPGSRLDLAFWTLGGFLAGLGAI